MDENERICLRHRCSVKTILIALRSQDSIDHALRVLDTCKQLFGATALFERWQPIRTNLAMLIDVSHGAHQWTEDHFRVVLEEVDLAR